MGAANHPAAKLAPIAQLVSKRQARVSFDESTDIAVSMWFSLSLKAEKFNAINTKRATGASIAAGIEPPHHPKLIASQ